MTDIKKKEKGKSGAKPKKLQVYKETLKDLSVGNAKQVKGGGLCQYTVHASC